MGGHSSGCIPMSFFHPEIDIVLESVPPRAGEAEGGEVVQGLPGTIEQISDQSATQGSHTDKTIVPDVSVSGRFCLTQENLGLFY